MTSPCVVVRLPRPDYGIAFDIFVVRALRSISSRSSAASTSAFSCMLIRPFIQARLELSVQLHWHAQSYVHLDQTAAPCSITVLPHFDFDI